MQNKNNALVMDIINLMVQVEAILPEAKVKGTDMFGRKQNDKPSMMDLLNKKIEELKELDDKHFTETWDLIQGMVDDKVQEVLDSENDLHRNEEVDDVQFRYVSAEMTQRGLGEEDYENPTKPNDQGWEYKGARAEVARIYGVADDAVLRYKRMAVRLAIVAKLESNMETKALVDQVNDSLVEELMTMKASKMKLPVEMEAFDVSEAEIKTQEKIINSKDQASFFRLDLEKKAEILRTMCIKAEELMRAYPNMDSRTFKYSYIQTTINVAEKLKKWCERYFNGGKQMRSMRRYSYRAICALYNECLDTLVALGVYKDAFYRTDKATKEVYSFFMKKTRENMVQVKSGLNWADELRTGFYEADDGTGRTAVRGSGD